MKGIDFDMRELEYLGVPVQDSTVCALRKESGVTNMDQWFASKTAIKLGGLGPGNSTSDVARAIKATLDLPIQLVEGYKGTAEIRLAADAGELQGSCWAWESMKVNWASGFQARDVNVAPGNGKKNPRPSQRTGARPGQKRGGASVIKPAPSIRRPLCGCTSPRPHSKNRLQILRSAFMNTLTDPEFLAETKKTNLDVNPLTGEEVKKIVDELFKLKPEVVSKLANILAAK